MRDGNGSSSPVLRLVTVPAAITLGITLLRLVGERLGGPPLLFSRAVGGGAALVGIIWLVPVFAVYFAWRLIRMEPAGVAIGRGYGFAAAGLIVFAAGAAAGFAQATASAAQFTFIGLGAAGGIGVAWRAWPALAATLFAYGVAARVPVAFVILLGILNGWGTHYDTPPPGLPPLSPIARWIAIGLIPQATIWMAVTVIGGLLFGLATVAVRSRWKRVR